MFFEIRVGHVDHVYNIYSFVSSYVYLKMRQAPHREVCKLDQCYALTFWRSLGATLANVPPRVVINEMWHQSGKVCNRNRFWLNEWLFETFIGHMELLHPDTSSNCLRSLGNSFMHDLKLMLSWIELVVFLFPINSAFHGIAPCMQMQCNGARLRFLCLGSMMFV